MNLQLPYTLMAQRARNTRGGHTEPRYADLTREEKELHEPTPCLSPAQQFAAKAQTAQVMAPPSAVMLSDIPSIILLRTPHRLDLITHIGGLLGALALINQPLHQADVVLDMASGDLGCEK